MAASEGILTERGGMTSHAALVARQMGKVCVVGCGALNIDYQLGEIRVHGNSTVLREGDYISIDGSTGEVIAGEVATKNSEIIEVLVDKTLKPEDAPTWPIYKQLMEWADKYRKLNIRTNADQPDQAEIAITFGAEGIGLCRTEHMFFGGERIDAMREMILADDIEGRRKALEKLLPYQREDFYGLFKTMGSRPVTIRLLDPPLHEFLPHTDGEIKVLAKKMGKSYEIVTRLISDHHEFNPMLGLRGCRLGILHPEITVMQVRAIIEAACRLKKEGLEVIPEIMVPLISTVKELEITSEIIHKTARSVIAEQGTGVKYLVGTMIDVPRAAITSDQIATAADIPAAGYLCPQPV